MFSTTVVSGSHGSSLAFSQRSHPSRMEIGITLVPVSLSVDFAITSEEARGSFVGVYILPDGAIEVDPIPVSSIVVDGTDGNCSTAASAGNGQAYCSVTTGAGFCSVRSVGFPNNDADCSVGLGSTTAVNCSVKASGTCSVKTSSTAKFCSTLSKENGTGFCSVTANGNGHCSVTSGASTCSVKEGDAQAETTGACSVAKLENEGDTKRCSVLMGASVSGECSAYGAGDGVRFCSVYQHEDGANSACTTFKQGGNVAKCSAHGNPANPNNKCSVMNLDGTVTPPDATGKCAAPDGPAGPGQGASWRPKLQLKEWDFQNQSKRVCLFCSVSLLMVAFMFIAKSRL